MTSDQIGSSAVVRPRGSVEGVEVDGEIVLYDADSQQAHLLNPTASVIWDCLDGTVALGELASDLADEFGADPAEVGDQVVAIVRSFDELGLLDVVSA
jgi:PqqD family protein of HPr-rel-A system